MSLIGTIDLLGVKEIANLARGRRRRSRILRPGARPINKDWERSFACAARKKRYFLGKILQLKACMPVCGGDLGGLEAGVLTQAGNLAAG